MMPKWSSYWEMAQNDARAEIRAAGELQNDVEHGLRALAEGMANAAPRREELPTLPEEPYRGGATRCATCGQPLDSKDPPPRWPSLRAAFGFISTLTGLIAIAFHDTHAGALAFGIGICSVVLWIDRSLERQCYGRRTRP